MHKMLHILYNFTLILVSFINLLYTVVMFFYIQPTLYTHLCTLAKSVRYLSVKFMLKHRNGNCKSNLHNACMAAV